MWEGATLKYNHNYIRFRRRPSEPLAPSDIRVLFDQIILKARQDSIVVRSHHFFVHIFHLFSCPDPCLNGLHVDVIQFVDYYLSALGGRA